MKTSPLTLNLHNSKLRLHFSSNPLILYPLLALLVLLSSKPFSSLLAPSLSTSLKNLWNDCVTLFSLMTNAYIVATQLGLTLLMS